MENRSWQKKNISRLEDTSGNLITNPGEILKNIHVFYESLYSSKDDLYGVRDENEINQALFDKLNIPKLSEDQKQTLDSPLSQL